VGLARAGDKKRSDLFNKYRVLRVKCMATLSRYCFILAMDRIA